MSTSLANFISSLVAGGIVVSLIAIALVIISKSDRVTRSQIFNLSIKVNLKKLIL